MCSIDTSNGQLEWILTKESMLQVYPELSKNYELGGKFAFIYKNGIIHRRTSHNKIHKNKGSKDSVSSPNGILNFHTHPISCYLQEKTIWGWPSGEDIRETIIFGLKGTLAHAVLAIEGCYLIQISNCAIQHLINISTNKLPPPKLIDHFFNAIKYKNTDTSSYLKNFEYDLNNPSDPKVLTQIFEDILRGLIIVFIEIYFRSSHRFRAYSFNKKTKITPYDYIKMIDSFKIRNIINHKNKVSGCGNVIHCNGIPIGAKNVTSLKKYIEDYEYDTGFYICDKLGNVISVDIPIRELLDIIPVIEEVTKQLDSCKEWFHLSLTENMILYNNNYYDYIKLPTDTQMNLLKYYDKTYSNYISKNIFPLKPISDAKFHWFSMKGDCSYKDIHNYRQQKLPKRSNNNSFYIIGSEKCPYTVKAYNLLRSKHIPVDIEYYPTIEKAISVSKTQTIPSVYYYGKHIGGYDDLKKLVK